MCTNDTNIDFTTQPLAIILIGASGDLAKKKTFPSLYQLYIRDFLQNDVVIYGYGRSMLTQEELHIKILPYLSHGTKVQKKTFLSKCYYQVGQNYTDVVAFREMLSDLESIRNRDKRYTNTIHTSYNYLFYMATPPNVFEDVTKTIAESFHDVLSSSSVRFLYEKPFGKDLDSYKQLS